MRSTWIWCEGGGALVLSANDLVLNNVNCLLVLDVKFVEANARQLLTLAYAARGESSRIVRLAWSSCERDQPAVMSHIPLELIAGNPSGIVTWQAAAFIVDVGEIDLSITAKQNYSLGSSGLTGSSACGETPLWRLRAAKLDEHTVPMIWR